MKATVQPNPSLDAVLGAHVDDRGTGFALWAPRATRVELALVDEHSRQSNHDLRRDDSGIWRIHLEGIGPGQQYGYRVHGPWNPRAGQRFNPARLLVDPYARAITGGVDYSGPITDHTAASNYDLDPTDSAGYVPLSVVVADSPPPTPLTKPRPVSDLILYETHLRGFTQMHPSVPEHLRGTFAGMAYPAVIDYLVELGVNAVEFLPLHHFISEPFVVGRGLSNYWGYNTLGYFAPHAHYCASGTRGEQVAEFKAMVSALHQAGIAVILDVVYNHTGEGGHEGPTLAFRGIDHAAYYRLTDDQRNDYDVTGCGNAFDTSTPGALKLVLDSLKYWVTDMGVDGFRFDLATTLIRDATHHVDQEHPFKKLIAADPVLSTAILIAEPWDLGPFGYQVGAWGAGWSEWNDRFRDVTRDAWRNATYGVGEFATRLSGSSDLYNHHGRPPQASVNFVTAHDGFTLRDLVTYDLKHNEANTERNHDGSDDNRSSNHGYEGETADPQINASRLRTAKGLMATLLLSSGIPMITAGDEFGRTQGGNNNAYCQDSPISWLNWTPDPLWDEQRALTQRLIALRHDYPLLRPDFWRQDNDVVMDERTSGRPRIRWLTEEGNAFNTALWNEPNRRFLGLYLADATHTLLIYFHLGDRPVSVTLPGPELADSITLLLHTGNDDELSAGPFIPSATLVIPGRTVAIFQVTPPGPESSAQQTEAGTPATPGPTR